MMHTTSAELLAEIERFTAAEKMAETTFGRKAVNDGKFVSRLRQGGRCWPETAEKALSFIAEHDQSERVEAAG